MPTRREASQTVHIEGLYGLMATDFAHLVKVLKRDIIISRTIRVMMMMIHVKSRITLVSAKQTKVGLFCRLLSQ